MLDRLPRSFINHIELWLSGAALVLIFGIPVAVGPGELQFWRLTALVAVAVGTLHGVIFWVVRRRQRKIRQQSIRDIQAMLADVVKNRLTAIDMYLPEADDPEMVRQEVEGVRASIQEIAEEVDSLSEETLQAWEEKYEGALRHTAERQSEART
jgi:hypothetical protein